MADRHERRFFLRMSFYDNEGQTFGERAIEISSAWCGYRPSFISLEPPTPGLGTMIRDDPVEINKVREFRREQFIVDAKLMGEALVDHLEAKEGWINLESQDRAREFAAGGDRTDAGEIDISKLNKAAVLAALYNRARVQGLGAFQAVDGPMAIDEARRHLKKATYFDYLHGRVMKVDLGGDVLRTRLYDRDNGQGAAARALREAGLIT